jgi:ubiquinone/menaquinone biosynthesis C-methylase UbiE
MNTKTGDNKLKDLGTHFRNEIIDLWKTKSSADFMYFIKGESEKWLAKFWEPESRFIKLFNQLDTTRCAEIACGFGRHSAQIANRCQELFLIDTSIDALVYAQQRFNTMPNVRIILSEDGLSMPGIADHYLTSVFCYDAMVHFEPLTVVAYLAEINRTLAAGGKALLHHSNFSGNPTGKISDVIGGRNYMTQDLFAHFCSRNGLKIIEQHLLDWSFDKSDALSLIEKI